MDAGDRERWIERWVARNWTGPVRSPLDGEIYSTREAYAEHLLAAGALPAPDPFADI